MASADINHIASMQTNVCKSHDLQSDINYLPAVSTQAPPLDSNSMSVSAPPPPYSVSVPPSFYIPPGQPMQPHIYSQPVVLVMQRQVQYQGILVPNNLFPRPTMHIRDYMIWSIINVFLGGLSIGFLGVLFSLLTKRRKQEGDVQGATTMSRITLIANILITILFFVLTGFLIVYLTIYSSLLTGD